MLMTWQMMMAGLSLGLIQDAPLPSGTDGQQRPLSTESIVTFRCDHVAASIVYVQRRLPSFDLAPSARSLPVALRNITVNGRQIPAAQRQRLNALFAAYARVDQADAICFDREIYVNLRGTAIETLRRVVNEGSSNGPGAAISTIVLMRDGLVRIDVSDQVAASLR